MFSDHAKTKRYFSYDMDSVMVDSLYKPQVKTAMNENFYFLSEYQYINDTFIKFAVLNKAKPVLLLFNQFFR